MNKIFAIKYHPDNPKVLLSGGWDQNVLIWDLNTETPINVINGPVIYGEGLDMNPFGEILTATWRKDNPLQLWDFATQELKKNFEFNETNGVENAVGTQLYCCKFSKDFGRYVFAGGSVVNAAKVFDWQGNLQATIGDLSHAVLCMDSSNNVTGTKEHYLAIGGGEGAVRVLKYEANPIG
ncbi:MAG: WD40 repeat domain-containing protein [archaeon]|nr:WD40 repeat domain-containing protein [archaeon]